MGKLKEYLSEEKTRWQSERPERDRAVQEWTAALRDLYERIDGWIREDDDSGLLSIQLDSVHHYERKLGNCELPRMKVVYEASEILFQPRYRFSVALKIVDDRGQPRAADGYVSVFCPEPSGHQIFRIVEGGVSRWFITPSLGHKHKVEYAEFTRDEAEGLLVGLLK